MSVQDDDPIDEARVVGMTAAMAASRVGETVLRNMQERSRQRQQASHQEQQEAERRLAAQAQLAEQHLRAAANPQWWRTAQPSEQGATWQAAQAWAGIDPERFHGVRQQITQQVESRYGPELSDRLARLGPEGRDIGGDLVELAARRRDEAAGQRHEAGEARDQSRGDESERDASDSGAQREHRAAALDSSAATAGEAGQAEYDTAERRQADDLAMQQAGVSSEAREARTVADHGNGTDPNTAASSGRTGRTGRTGRGGRTAGAQPQRSVGRGR